MSDSRDATAPSIAATDAGVTVPRRFTEAGTHPFDSVEWEIRDALIGDPANPAFEQRGVEFPKTWSQNATNIVAQKYFRGRLGSAERESLGQADGRPRGRHDRRAGAARAATSRATTTPQAFEDELTHILLHQMAAFNSPVWFNVGFEESPQCSACFILSVEDTIESILDWNTKEGMIFRGGSGSGINLSNIRGSKEHLSKGGTASGPVSFMRGADAWAGTIKSGGKTRRAAKMVVLDVDHPDVLDFIWCKAREEEKAARAARRRLRHAIDGEGFASIQYQNANNSVRVTDEFMERAERGEDWELTARIDGSVGRDASTRARCSSRSPTPPGAAPIRASSTTRRSTTGTPARTRAGSTRPTRAREYMHVDDSACNLASLNLMKFRREDGTLRRRGVRARGRRDDPRAGDRRRRRRATRPRRSASNARAFRQLGLGYANLGALLMANGLAYDSDEGRALCGAITALMTGPRLPHVGRGGRRRSGPYERYEENRDPHNRVMRKHRDAAYELDGQLLATPTCSRRRSAPGTRRSTLGERARLPQRAGHGARAHRHDLVPDGLRHDRHRARLLARQVQGAGRRRPDDDRQPHRAAGAAHARLLRPRGRADRGVPRRARHDRRRARAAGRAPAGVRRGRRRAGDLAHGPHQDDGRGAAVHLGRDLEDGQPARVGHGRGHRRGLHARAGSSA